MNSTAKSHPLRSSDEQQPSREREPGGNAFVGGLIGVSIAVGCVLPPLLHLVTGPLGPFLGGFVAGSYARPSARGRALIAAMIGTGLAVIVAAGAEISRRNVDSSELPSWFPSGATLALIVAGVWIYGTLLSAVGASIAGALAHRKTKFVQE